MYVGMYVFRNECMYVCMFVGMNICMYVCRNECMYVCMCIYIHIVGVSLSVFIHIHTCVFCDMGVSGLTYVSLTRKRTRFGSLLTLQCWWAWSRCHSTTWLTWWTSRTSR